MSWEIRGGLRATSANPRTGLLGILAPTYRAPWNAPYHERQRAVPHGEYWRYNIPPVLWDNVDRGYAMMRPWPSSATELRTWIHEAFLRRTKQPDPSLVGTPYTRNRTGSRWQP